MKNLKRSALGLSFLIALLCLQGCGERSSVIVNIGSDLTSQNISGEITEDGHQLLCKPPVGSSRLIYRGNGWIEFTFMENKYLYKCNTRDASIIKLT